MTITLGVYDTDRVIKDQTFAETLEVLTQPTYGRVLFTEPARLSVIGCWFIVGNRFDVSECGVAIA